MSAPGSDKTVLLSLYEEKRADLVRLFAARLSSRAEAEDLAKELSLRLTAQGGDAPTGAPLTLLHRMGSNLMQSRLRDKREAGGRRPQAETRSPAGENFAHPRPTDHLGARQRLRTLAEAVDDLPEKARHAFQLHRLEGLSNMETARRMGVSVSTAEEHISLALKTLTRRLR